jgi:hypothetical protein
MISVSLGIYVHSRTGEKVRVFKIAEFGKEPNSKLGYQCVPIFRSFDKPYLDFDFDTVEDFTKQVFINGVLRPRFVKEQFVKGECSCPK